jgi:hypothetical protein
MNSLCTYSKTSDLQPGELRAPLGRNANIINHCVAIVVALTSDQISSTGCGTRIHEEFANFRSKFTPAEIMLFQFVSTVNRPLRTPLAFDTLVPRATKGV